MKLHKVKWTKIQIFFFRWIDQLDIFGRKNITFKARNVIKYTLNGTGISRKEKFHKENLNVFISLFIIIKLFLNFESFILFKLNKLLVAIGKKPAPGDQEFSLKIFICKLSLARCPRKMFLCPLNSFNQTLHY